MLSAAPVSRVRAGRRVRCMGPAVASAGGSGHRDGFRGGSAAGLPGRGAGGCGGGLPDEWGPGATQPALPGASRALAHLAGASLGVLPCPWVGTVMGLFINLQRLPGPWTDVHPQASPRFLTLPLFRFARSCFVPSVIFLLLSSPTNPSTHPSILHTSIHPFSEHSPPTHWVFGERG